MRLDTIDFDLQRSGIAAKLSFLFPLSSFFFLLSSFLFPLFPQIITFALVKMTVPIC